MFIVIKVSKNFLENQNSVELVEKCILNDLKFKMAWAHKIHSFNNFKIDWDSIFEIVNDRRLLISIHSMTGPP